ncbi:hypothetical protein APA_1353 [Pseudanabaena sp. lw0831]|uniref:diguanylate cyclase n=1 Tax=Pseudanabaena sp. lw0831 TaxID=1357935 RepID=UPI001915DF8A|nr:diguanylate cyclase [Pseudanabaena sp. lw0831]GBO53446.1 hypothetical protein APA_1353 [Pseudanabaena sp. lw0831]
MPSQITIPKKNNQALPMDREQLYAIGLKHIQTLSSQIWTDYNVHDPGVTTLELLCYALTDLSYRASLPIADLLASKSDNANEMKNQFFTARQILPNRPLTILDYRKLLIDIPSVKNAWVQSDSQAYYADIVNSFNPDLEDILEPSRLGCATLFTDDIIDLRSLATKLNQSPDRKSQYINGRLTAKTKEVMPVYLNAPDEISLDSSLRTLLVWDLNRIIQNITVQNGANRSVSLYESQHFADVRLSEQTLGLLALNIGETQIERLNRMLLEDAYPEISKNQWLRDRFTRQSLKKIDLAGLYEVKIEYEEDITTDAAKLNVIQAVRQKLLANRNLCEDFVRFDQVETQLFQLCAELELAPDANVTKINAAILSQVQQYLSPSVKFYTLSEMLTRYPVDHIFDGPALDHGFINDDELETADLLTEIRLSDIISIIMDITGVQAVRDIVINPEGSRVPLVNKWVIPVENGKQPKLSKASRLVFYKRNMPVVAGVATAPPVKDNSPTEINDLEIPLGTYRELADYYSFQNHFPVIYGVSEIGLSSDADEKRQALAYQLKAYLLFFDQIMANYLAQLSKVKELFSINPSNLQTYLYHVVNSFTEYNKIYSTTDAIATLQDHDRDREIATGCDRRNRFLDHLIARFAERFHDFANTMYSVFGESPENMIRYKCEFLEGYPAISQERSLAYNYRLTQDQDLWDTDNVSGLEKRLAKLLGIRNHQRRNLSDSSEGMYLIENILLRPEQNTDPFLPICPAPDCNDCAEVDPYSYRIHVILPAYSDRFRNINFRRFVEEVIREETPAHILPKVCWISQENMTELDKLYRDWIYLKAGVETTDREKKLKDFINKLFKLKNVYEPQKLSECDSEESQPKFILGRTALGTEPTIKTE